MNIWKQKTKFYNKVLLLTAVCVNGVGLGIIWTLGLLSFFFQSYFFFQSFRYICFRQCVKIATKRKRQHVNSNIFFPQAEKTQLCATSAQSQKKWSNLLLCLVWLGNNLDNVFQLGFGLSDEINTFFFGFFINAAVNNGLRQWLGSGFIRLR